MIIALAAAASVAIRDICDADLAKVSAVRRTVVGTAAVRETDVVLPRDTAGVAVRDWVVCDSVCTIGAVAVRDTVVRDGVFWVVVTVGARCKTLDVVRATVD